jgi:hypothetical protein
MIRVGYDTQDERTTETLSKCFWSVTPGEFHAIFDPYYAKCPECGIYPSDDEKRLCEGCEAYREHTAT